MITVKALGRWLVWAAVNLLVALALLEGIFLMLLHSPRLVAASPKPIQGLVQQMYRHFNRSFIQFEPACAQYDPDVTYTLRPGRCTFANEEFSTEVDVNRLGLRDTDAALVAPEVIMLGDSHVMGWGVRQDETLARVLARKTGLKVLNAAVSSYATVRERRMLDRLDTSNLKVLFIQYADNDLPENRTFRQHDGNLPITSEAQYQTIVRHYQSQQSYFPGKYSYRLFMKVLRLEAPEPDQLKMEVIPAAEEAQLFLYALERAGRTSLDNVQVIVFEMNKQEPTRPFIAALDRERSRPEHPPYVRRLVAYDVGPRLKPSNFYIVDDHMNASGHEEVGEALAELVRTLGFRK
jgi:hypothetical protein